MSKTKPKEEKDELSHVLCWKRERLWVQEYKAKHGINNAQTVVRLMREALEEKTK